MKQSFSILIICIFALASCRQITKSVEETVHPKDTVANNRNKSKEEGTSGKYTGTSTRTSGNTVITETHTTTHTEGGVDKKNSDFLTDTKALQQAETALKNLPQYAGKEILVYSYIYFRSSGNISLILRNPVQPKYLDRYEYSNGEWSKPAPVPVSIKDNIENMMVPLSKINFATVAKVAGIYNEKAAEIEGAEPTTDFFVYLSNHEINWTPTMHNKLTGSRARYSIEFNSDGTLKKFKQE